LTACSMALGVALVLSTFFLTRGINLIYDPLWVYTGAPLPPRPINQFPLFPPHPGPLTQALFPGGGEGKVCVLSPSAGGSENFPRDELPGNHASA
jgi:hypothetical protein